MSDSQMADGGIVESVERIVVEALARQYSWALRATLRGEPDSEVVTRDIINAIADELERERGFSWETRPNYSPAIQWLRSQANGGTDD